MAGQKLETIREISRQCLSLFTKKIENGAVLEEQDASPQGNLIDELGRFRLWASNIGVFAQVHASLDFRLRELPDVIELFLTQLHNIRDRLDQLLQMSTFEQLPNRPDNYSPEHIYQCPECGITFSNPADAHTHLEQTHANHRPILTGLQRQLEIEAKSSFESWSADEVVQSIHDSIGWLHRLSNMVRKASFGRQNKRADELMLGGTGGSVLSPVAELSTDGLEKLYDFYIKKYAAGLSEEIASRLLRTMIIRHKRILYRRARRQAWNLEDGENKAPKINQTLRHTIIPSSATIPPIPMKKEPSLPSKPPVSAGLSTSQVTATTVDIDMLRKNIALSQVSKATSHSLSISDQILIPPPPTIAKRETEVVCDYCGLILQASQALDKKTWAKHIRGDLDPYICVFGQCETPLEIYTTRREWLAHMRTRHRMRWHCFATSHESSYFESPNMLNKHLREQHDGHFTEEEISILVENSGHPIDPVIEHCPFCQEPCGEYEDHVARHLTQFALLSLPWPEDGYKGSHESQSSHGESSSSSAAGTRETMRDLGDMADIKLTDWLQWETNIPAEMKHPQDLVSTVRYQRTTSTSDDEDLVGLHWFMTRNYDAAEDPRLESFRRRASIDAVGHTRPKDQASGQEEDLKFRSILSRKDATGYRDLNRVQEIYGKSSAIDDLGVIAQPIRHVDYLSYEWREEDISSSWRYVVSNRDGLNNSTRLENAAWRAWAKIKDDLGVISPEILNWLKDCDVTWLYGPWLAGKERPLFPLESDSPPSLTVDKITRAKKFGDEHMLLGKQTGDKEPRWRPRENFVKQYGEGDDVGDEDMGADTEPIAKKKRPRKRVTFAESPPEVFG